MAEHHFDKVRVVGSSPAASIKQIYERKIRK